MAAAMVASDGAMTFASACPLVLVLLAGCGASSSSAVGFADSSNVDAVATDSELGDVTQRDAPVVVTDTASSDGGKCTSPGYDCTSSTCCAGSTCETTTGHCVSPPGGPCDMSAPNPDAFCAWGYVCESGKCVAMKCVETKNSGVCSSFPGIDCCDPMTKCTKIMLGGSTSDACCAPDGTVLPTTDSYKCCSASVTATGDPGKVQCIPPPT